MNSQAQLKPGRRRRWWLLGGLAFLVLFGVWFGLTRDDDLEPDADLLPRSAEETFLPPGQAHPLATIVGSMSTPTAFDTAELLEFLHGVQDPDGPGQSDVNAHFAANKSVLARIQDFVDGQSISYDSGNDETPLLMELRAAWRLLQFATEVAYQDGAKERVRALLETQLRLCRQVTSGYPTMILHSIGMSLQMGSLVQIRRFSFAGWWAPREVAALNRWIEDSLCSTWAGTRRAMQGEYRFFVSAVYDIQSQSANMTPEEQEFLDVAAPGFSWDLTFKPNRTRNRMARFLRRRMTLESPTFKELTSSGDTASIDALLRGERPENSTVDNVLAAIRGNIRGDRILAQIRGSYFTLFRRQFEVLFNAQALRVWLALRAYETEHDVLPERLQDLVPAYIDTVPVDPFDGMPIRYSRERRLLYSVGPSVADRGGAISEAAFGEFPTIMLDHDGSDNSPAP